MSDQPLTLGSEFDVSTEADWRDLVDKALKGADFEKKLVTKTYDGIRIAPLYTENDWLSETDASGLPGQPPLTRGLKAITPGDAPWDIRVCHSHPDPKAANKAILEDLQGGATSIELVTDPAGERGICIHSLSDLEETLDGVFLDMISVTLTARGGGSAAAHLAALWRKQGIALEQAKGAFNFNPLGTALATGQLSLSMEDALKATARIAKHVANTYPNVTSFSVDARITNDAGATGPQGVGNALATGLAYLKAMTDVGMKIEDAANQITFTLVTDANFYENIVRGRVARKLWGRIIQECGGDVSRVNTKIHVESVSRTMTKRDPWVNILRTTVAAFGAALGGANSISVLPFTHALGQPTSLARRIARNSQIILAEESNLGKVMDPAGGSWALEKLTDEYARTSWTNFQDIEAQGGIVAAIRSGWLQNWITKARDQRSKNVAKRKTAITGVSEFPHLEEGEVAFESVDFRKIAEARNRAPSGVTPASTSFSDIVDASLKGATSEELLSPFSTEAETFEALAPHRLSANFEALRDASDAHLARAGTRPQIFLVNIGPIAEFTARASFAKNFFEAGGIATLSNDGFEVPNTAVDAFKSSSAQIAILCSSDRLYSEKAMDFARAVKEGGAKRLYLAGHPGDAREALITAGIDEFIHIGTDLIDVLARAHDILGVTK